MASDAEKPDGFLELTAERRATRFAEASPGLIPGIGPKTVAQLERARHRDARPRSAPRPTSSSPSGSAPGSAPTSRRLARFEDDRTIETVRIAKSESRETTFDRDLRGLEQLEPVLAPPDRASCATRSRAQERRGRTIGIKVRFDDFCTVTRARCSTPRSTTRDGRPVALELLRRLDPRRPVRLLGVRVAGLDEDAARPFSDDQLSLSL